MGSGAKGSESRPRRGLRDFGFGFWGLGFGFWVLGARHRALKGPPHPAQGAALGIRSPRPYDPNGGVHARLDEPALQAGHHTERPVPKASPWADRTGPSGRRHGTRPSRPHMTQASRPHVLRPSRPQTETRQPFHNPTPHKTPTTIAAKRRLNTTTNARPANEPAAGRHRPVQAGRLRYVAWPSRPCRGRIRRWVRVPANVPATQRFGLGLPAAKQTPPG
jgi:hypothetical protein